MNDLEHEVPPADGTPIRVVESDERDVVVPVIEEFISVEKRLVETGHGIRLHKRVHEELVPIVEHLKAIDYVVERVVMDRPVEAMPEIRHEGDTMIVSVVEERVVTRIELILVEEIRLTRRETTSPMHQDVLVRREEVVVEHFDGVTATAAPSATRVDG